MSDLLKRAQQGDEEARNTFVKNNMGLVVGLAKRYFKKGEEEDIIQAGCLGLIKAMDRFDFSMNNAFSTYAVPMILGEIKKYFRDDGIIKVSRQIKNNALKIKSEREKFIQQHGEGPSVSQLAKRLNLEEEAVVLASGAIKQVVGISAEDDAGFSYEKVLGTEDEKLAEKADLKIQIEKLDYKEKFVVVNKYYNGMSQSQIAELLNISQAQVSRIEKSTLQKLKIALG